MVIDKKYVKPQIMSDFDSTLIVQNSLNVLTLKLIKYYIKRGQIGKLLTSIPVLWTRLREIYTAKQLIPEVLIFDDSDLVIKKARRLKGVPYSLFFNQTVPLLEINRSWIEIALKFMKKYNINKPVIIVSRNGKKEIFDFLEYKDSQKNLEILKDKNFLESMSKITKKKYNPNTILIRKGITNRDILNFFGIKVDIIANKFCKRQVIIDNEKDYIYTGIVLKTHEIGVIERRNKAILYENNLVIADKEEKMYKTWAKEFVCVQH